MEMTIADLVTYLENDLAEFYAGLRAIPRLRAVEGILQHMEEECRKHAVRTAAISRAYAVPPAMQLGAIMEVQARLKQHMSTTIISTPEPAAVLRAMIAAEETLALFYQRIAERIRSLMPANSQLVDEFEQLARDELLHRDAVAKVFETLSQS